MEYCGNAVMKAGSKSEDSHREGKRWNFFCFCFVVGIIGTEYGFIVPTLYSYLKDVVRTPHLNLWFGLITSSYFVSSIIGSLTIGKYADSTREIRRIILGTCLFVSMGNVVYAVSHTASLVLIGRFMQGFGDAVVPVLIGEITKTYTEEEESYSKLSTMTSVFYVTYISSPVIASIFNSCDFKLLGMHFTVYNLPAYIISICWFVLGIVSYFIVSNPSSTATTNDDLNSNERLIQSNNNKPQMNSIIEPKMLSVRELLSCSQYRIVLLLTGLFAYFAASFFTIYTPMVAKQLYNLPTYWTSALFASCGITLVAVLLLSSRYNLFNEKEIYYLIWGSCSVVMSIQLLSIAIILYKFKEIGAAFLAVSTISTGFTFAVEQVVLAGLLGKFIPRSTQAYAAGIRRSVNNVCFIFGAFVAPLISEYILVHDVVYSCLMCLIALYLIFKRQIFENTTFIDSMESS